MHEPKRTAALPEPPEPEALVRAAAESALDKKAVDLKILHLEPVSDFTDYFLVCSGTNERQVQAIAESVERRLRTLKARPLHVEGLKNAQWVLLDYGDFLVHVFDQERRDFYGLERLWGDAADVTAELSP
ncbi:MAG: ribosome silencing factor [Acidobacteria bacterium]|nr:ribosome silencing factor [Acidobacteriota bacterium]